MILDLLSKGKVKANVNAFTWEDAGKAAGQLLIDAGDVEAGYIDAILDSVRKYGPYIVIAPGVALFHARPQDGVNRVCMSMITLKNGVDFNAGEKDPVKLVIAFGAVDDKMHIKALTELMEILKDKDLINRIEHSEDEFQIIEALKLKFQ